MKINISDNHFSRIIQESIDKILFCEEKEDFNEWFSHGGIADENGEPLLVYHGSGKDFDKFDIERTYEGVMCFSPIKKEALIYTHWDMGDDNWRTINEAYDYLMDEGYELDERLEWPEKLNLLNMVNSRTKEKIDEEYAYNVIREFYEAEYSSPTLYYCIIRNAKKNEWYDYEYDVSDMNDIWVVKKEKVNYKPIPKYPSDELNTYIQ